MSFFYFSVLLLSLHLPFLNIENNIKHVTLHTGQQASTTFSRSYRSSNAWWSVGEYMNPGLSLTHQSVGLTLAQDNDDIWDLSDSLADLYKEVNRRDKSAPLRQNSSDSRQQENGGGGKATVDVARWIMEDTSHGIIRVFMSDSDVNSELFPCTLSTPAQKICAQMGIPNNSLHVQFNGDIIRRMESFDCPLAVQNEYLASIGYSDLRRVQEEGSKEDLQYLVKFYAGRGLRRMRENVLVLP